jgi:G:T/U-mismatch repair DNA glycosylase
MYIQAVGIKGMHFRYGHVVNRFNAVLFQALDGRNKAVPVEGALVGVEGLLQALSLVSIGKSDACRKCRKVCTADDQFVQRLRQILLAAAFAIRQCPRASGPAIAVNG